MHAPILVRQIIMDMKLIRFLLAVSVFITLPVSATEQPTTAFELRELGSRYELARGVQQDFRRAWRLYCISAALGDVEARYNLGWIYFNGRGVKANHGLAAGWFKQAESLGDRFAGRMLDRISAVNPEKDSSCPVAIRGNLKRKQIEVLAGIIAEEKAIDPQLVLAVIRAESAFNPKALSHKNAQGLMQLIPKTASRFGVRDSWNPVENILGGVSYLQWLMRHFKGDVRFVLAAYNAGEDAVQKYKGVPPYNETRHYVKKIMVWYKKEEHPVPPA